MTKPIMTNLNQTTQQLQMDEKTFFDIKKLITQISIFRDFPMLMEYSLCLEDNLNGLLNSDTFERLKIIQTFILTPEHLITRNFAKRCDQQFTSPVRYLILEQYLNIIALEEQ